MNLHPLPDNSIRKTWKILIIEDDEEDLFILKEMLKQAQGNTFEVHWASSYKAGYQALETDHYNAVLVDYDLGAETGIQLIREAVEKGYAVPLILFTGRGTYAVDLQAMEAGATLYLSKNEATPLLLERSIRYAIELKQREQALRESEARYRSLYEALDEGFMLSEVIFDEHNQPVDILYHQANPAAVRMLGLDYSGKRLTEIDPNFEPYWFETWAHVVRTGMGERLERYAEPLKAWYNFYIFRAGGPDSTIVASVFEDITQRKQVEAQLKAAAARNAYLVKLADALRPLSDPAAIKAEAERALGEFLGASRVMYGEVAQGGEDLIVERNYVAEAAPLLTGRFRMVDFGPALIAGLNAGCTIVVPEIAAAPALSLAEREAYLNLGIAAAVSVPLTKDGRFVANLNVHQAAPRAWSEKEIALIEETAERTWAAVERARAETALRERESRMREFLESTHDTYFALDREWRFTYVNHHFGSLMGIDPYEVIGKNFWEMYPQYLGTDVEQCYRKVMTERVPVHFQRQGIYTTNYYDLALYPTQEGLASFGSNRTEEIRRQQQLEDERARLEAVLSALPVGVWITDINGRIIGKNQRSDQIWAGDAPMSDNWEKYAEYEMRDPGSGNLRLLEEYPLVRVLSTGQPVEPQENLIRRFDGTDSFALVSASPIHDRAGRLTGAVAIMLDISEQVRLETERQKAIRDQEIHRQLTEQREMERQGIARDIHDGPIQTLSSLLFNLQSLREVYPDPALQLEIDRVKLSIKSTVQELRQVMYELRPPSVIQFGISRAIRSHKENLLEIYPQIIWNLQLEDDQQLLPQQACLMLFRIYQEAVNNIIRHSEARQAWVTLSVLPDQLILEIRDDGKGFVRSQNLAHFTENRHFGLAGMAERVGAINGALEVKSNPGEGTLIRVRVPIPPNEQ